MQTPLSECTLKFENQCLKKNTDEKSFPCGKQEASTLQFTTGQ